MTTRRKLIIGGAVVLALGAGGVGIAQAVGGDDEQATGADAERAKAAAVRLAGGGSAVAVEREDEGRSAWEVEVKQPDGSVTELDLTRGLERAGAERDDDDSRGDDDERGENERSDDD
jgi:hypothetical protein